MVSACVRRLDVFDHRCLHSIAGTGWTGHLINLEVRSLILDAVLRTLFQRTELIRLRWLGRLLHVVNIRLL